MDEHHFSEIDASMLYIEDARARVAKAAAKLRSAGADEHLIAALERTERQLSEAHRSLMQGTLFAVPRAQASL